MPLRARPNLRVLAGLAAWGLLVVACDSEEPPNVAPATQPVATTEPVTGVDQAAGPESTAPGGADAPSATPTQDPSGAAVDRLEAGLERGVVAKEKLGATNRQDPEPTEADGARGNKPRPSVPPPKAMEPAPTPAKKSGASPALADETDTALRELARLENKLRAAGVSLTHRGDGSVAASDAAKNEKLDLSTGQCEDVCTVTDSICSLASRICDMSDAHGGDERYAAACARAKVDCEVGSEACTGCRQ